MYKVENMSTGDVRFFYTLEAATKFQQNNSDFAVPIKVTDKAEYQEGLKYLRSVRAL